MRRTATLSLGALAIVAASAIVVLSLSAFDREATPPRKTKIICIPAAAFQPELSYKDYYNDGSRLYSTGGYGSFVAPLILPHGSKIRKIVLVCEDSSDLDEITLALCRESGEPVYGSYVCRVQSEGADYNERSFEATLSPTYLIDNINNQYYLRVEIYEHISHCFKHAKVYYRGSW